MEEVEYETEICFQNTDYIFSLATVQISAFDPGSIRMIIDVEEKMSGDIWRGDFQAKYVEEITTKAG